MLASISIHRIILCHWQFITAFALSLQSAQEVSVPVESTPSIQSVRWRPCSRVQQCTLNTLYNSIGFQMHMSFEYIYVNADSVFQSALLS